MKSGSVMFLGRFTSIAWALLALLFAAVRERWRAASERSELPGRLRMTLEGLGPTFVKLGQALSLRRDLLPDDYVVALRDLQDQVGPFPGEDAVREIEQAFRRKISKLFSEFDIVPMAAASIAQVHRARLLDGRQVVVKVRRPGIRVQIDRDMRALTVAVRGVLAIASDLQRFQPLRIVNEIWTNLRKESDFLQEAHSIRRFADAFRGWDTLNIPGVVEELYTESVLVQELSSGRSINDPAIGAEGPRLAQVFVDAYLHQFFVIGVFHGDPHPGNLFVMDDGRLCFHDFGLVGFLDRRTRRGLAMFLQAFVHQDAAWVLDAAIDLGVLGGDMNRGEFIRGIEEILADYAALPLKEWSLAQAFLRVARLGRGTNITIPHNLLVLMRALFLIENALRTLDPDFNILDSLLARGKEAMTAMIREAPNPAAAARLKHEATVTLQDLPALLGAWLHNATREGGQLTFTLRHEGLERLELHLDRSGNRVALALVTLGLYIAASLLMQHSLGPRLLGVPVLAALGYALALWLTFRLARGISRSGRL